jgi:hypothetical protein
LYQSFRESCEKKNLKMAIPHRPKIHPTPPFGSDVGLLFGLAKVAIAATSAEQ